MWRVRCDAGLRSDWDGKGEQWDGGINGIGRESDGERK